VVLDLLDLRAQRGSGTILLIIGAARFSPEYRQQTIYLLVGAAIPWIANIAYLSGLTASIVIDLTPIAFCLTSVIYAYQVFRFHMFSMVPVAHDSIVEGMNDGILVPTQAGFYINFGCNLGYDGVGNHRYDTFDWPAISEILQRFHQVYEIQDENHAVLPGLSCQPFTRSTSTYPVKSSF
jgi:hypothetical protein